MQKSCVKFFFSFLIKKLADNTFGVDIELIKKKINYSKVS